MTDKQPTGLEKVEIVDTDWQWPQYPRNAPRNHFRGPGEHKIGWEGDFLFALQNSGIKRVACQMARISVRLVNERVKADPEFAEAVKQAREDAVELLENAAWQRAINGTTVTKGIYHRGELINTESVTTYSDGLLKFLLEAEKPEKYKKQVDAHSNYLIMVREITRVGQQRGWDDDQLKAAIDEGTRLLKEG
jgi:hypothetical protein